MADKGPTINIKSVLVFISEGVDDLSTFYGSPHLKRGKSKDEVIVVLPNGDKIPIAVIGGKANIPFGCVWKKLPVDQLVFDDE